MNTYDPASSVSSLRGCINDALLIGEMLRKAGFAVQQIHDSRATQQAILTTLSREVVRLRAGDYLVFWNSSHGYQLPDINGDEETDSKDEAICTYDTDLRDPLNDDKLARILRGVHPKAKVFIGSDSCHSATVTRALFNAMVQLATVQPVSDLLTVDRSDVIGTLKTRAWQQVARDVVGQSVENEAGEQLYRVPRLFVPPADTLFKSDVSLLDLNRYVSEFETQPELESYSDEEDNVSRFGILEGQMHHLLLSGCRANEVSMDASFPQGFHGAMTYHFARVVLQAWKRQRAITYGEAHEAVLERLVDDGFIQKPELEGPEYLKDAPVFGYEPGLLRREQMQTKKSGTSSTDSDRMREKGSESSPTSRERGEGSPSELLQLLTSMDQKLDSIQETLEEHEESISELQQEIGANQTGSAAGGLTEEDLWERLQNTGPAQRLELSDGDRKGIQRVMQQLMVSGQDYLPVQKPRDTEQYDLGSHITVTVNTWWGPFGMAEIQFDREAVENYARAITFENLVNVRVPVQVAAVIVTVITIIREVASEKGVTGYFNLPTLAHIWVPR